MVMATATDKLIQINYILYYKKTGQKSFTIDVLDNVDF